MSLSSPASHSLVPLGLGRGSPDGTQGGGGYEAGTITPSLLSSLPRFFIFLWVLGLC